MREIKFRAWDNKRKKMCFDIDIYQVKSGDTVPFSWTGQWYFENGDKDCFFDNNGRGNELMQFTGLKDKNGKEIYEGDILGDIYSGGYIYWCERCNQFQYFGCKNECFACGGDVHWFELSVEKELEVIGNIHENPELSN